MSRKMKTKTAWTATIFDNNGGSKHLRKQKSASKMSSIVNSSENRKGKHQIHDNNNCKQENYNNFMSNTKEKSSTWPIKSSTSSSLPSSSSSSVVTGGGQVNSGIILTPSSTTVVRTASIKAVNRESSSVVMIRPKTLNVTREEQNAEARLFIREALSAWRAKARCNIVPAERLQELFHELQFYPSEKQISEMLQTAKAFARKGSKQLNGLTFGEFCVLAADLKRFRACNFVSIRDTKTLNSFSTTIINQSNTEFNIAENCFNLKPTTEIASFVELNREIQIKQEQQGEQHSNLMNDEKFSSEENRGKSNGIKSSSSSPTNDTTSSSPSESNAPEVFLGGSCNPTTWRADVAIPTLEKLGISFYNPQVSDWTPDLIELEYRAKEKARVLFFVMDSETRASAGAIEAAHIAGQNARQLVLVLHPYKPNQTILNESISPQEYLDLTRNQQILRELVIRRGLPVLDSIPSGLQRTKQILAGIRDPPSNIASILIVVRGAFNRVVNSVDDEITFQQCQRALSLLGYANSLLSIENLRNIILNQKHTIKNIIKKDENTETTASESSQNTCSSTKEDDLKEIRINFDEFCILAAFLSVLQQEIHESGCISPIKGTNLPPPPIFLTNMQEDIRGGEENVTILTTFSKQILRTTSCTSVPDDQRYHFHQVRNNQQLNTSSDYYHPGNHRDSGTSSPQPLEIPVATTSTAVKSKYLHVGKKSKISLGVEDVTSGKEAIDLLEDESDSNDSVFSSGGSSIHSNPCSDSFTGLEFRDVYLGGSCFLRTRWRQEYAIPFLESKGVTYHLPALHESIPPSQLPNGILKCPSFDAKYMSSSSNSCSYGITKKLSKKYRARRKDVLNKEQATNTQGESKEDKSNENDPHTSPADGANENYDEEEVGWPLTIRPNLFNPALLDSSRVLLFVITNETRSLAPMTLAAHCIGLMYNVVLCVQMLPEFCKIGDDILTPTAVKDYNRGRSYLIDLAKRQGVPVFNDLKSALECTVEKIKACNSRNSV